MDEVIFTHEYFMNEALKEARKALEKDEIPVGAIVVAQNLIVARAHNLTETLNDVTAHAEMQAITSAANTIGSKYLTGCTLYVTLEPCAMCGGALFWSQLDCLVYGTFDVKRGFSLLQDRILHPKTSVVSGIMETECELLLKEFFAKKRI